MEYSAQGYKNLDVNADDKRKQNRTKVLVGGGLLTIIVTISVIIGVVLHQKSKINSNDKDIHTGGDVVPDNKNHTHDVTSSDNPMWAVYSEMPDFSSIGTRINSRGDNTDQDMQRDFWEDKWFGGPVYSSVFKYDWEKNDDDSYKLINGKKIIIESTKTEIKNDLTEDLQDRWNARGEDGTYGLFKINNVQSNTGSGVLGQYFVDATFFATGLDSDTYNKLIELNDTKVAVGEIRRWNDFKDYINGYGRLVFYKQTGPNYYPGTTMYNPNDVTNIEVYEVYETYLENGLGNKDPMYGRFFKMDVNCLVGFLSYDTKPMKPALSGKGILLTNGEDAVKEGLWDISQESEPVQEKTLNNFYENEFAGQ